MKTEIEIDFTYFFPTNIHILVTDICETHVYEEGRGGEEVGVDLGYGGC